MFFMIVRDVWEVAASRSSSQRRGFKLVWYNAQKEVRHCEVE